MARKQKASGRPRGGSEPIVCAILETTLKQLDQKGFAQLSVEKIAEEAGVNKTSIYRRWPSKGELVCAAVQSMRGAEPPFRETGDVRRDVIRLLKTKARTLATPIGTRIAHALIMLEGSDREDFTQALGAQRQTPLRTVLRSAIARGDLPPSTDPGILEELLVAPLLNRLFIRDETISQDFIVGLVEHTLVGKKARAPVRKRSRRA